MPDFKTVNASDNPDHEKVEAERQAKRDQLAKRDEAQAGQGLPASASDSPAPIGSGGDANKPLPGGKTQAPKTTGSDGKGRD